MSKDGPRGDPRRRLNGRVSYDSQHDWVWEENRRLRKLLADARAELKKRPVVVVGIPVCANRQDAKGAKEGMH